MPEREARSGLDSPVGLGDLFDAMPTAPQAKLRHHGHDPVQSASTQIASCTELREYQEAASGSHRHELCEDMPSPVWNRAVSCMEWDVEARDRCWDIRRQVSDGSLEHVRAVDLKESASHARRQSGHGPGTPGLASPMWEVIQSEDPQKARSRTRQQLQRGVSCASTGSKVQVTVYGAPRPFSGSKGSSKNEHLRRHLYLQSFLRKHCFRDVHTPRRGGCCGESLYPIHVAAMSGDDHVVGILLQCGADPHETSSRGRTAVECAQGANFHGSHEKVLRLLRAAEMSPI